LTSYRLAVQHEQKGELDEALRLYRRAFRLDSHVDKAYHKEELRNAAASLSSASSSIQAHTEPSVEVLVTSVEKLAVTTVAGKVATGKLADVVSEIPNDIEFSPENEKLDIPIRKLPDEVVALVLRTLDHTSIERFATVSRKARLLSLDSSIWRYLTRRIYVAPQIPENLSYEEMALQYIPDYRRLYIERPRLRLDGVYIAVCHYIRPGLSENAWVQTSHLITYHRYLRFFPDGQVISLLANEGVEPQTVIPNLKPALRMKGLFIGTWRLHGATVLVTDLADPSGGTTRYTFQMTLTLRSRPMGRWNKLEFVEYESVDCVSGEVMPLVLKHERPFWFSKVRSYV